MNRHTKTLLTGLGIILFFLILSYAYVPEVLSGKVVDQGDIRGWKGMAQEAMTFNKANPDDPTAWTDSMFGGMPTTTTIDDFKGDWTDPIYDLLLLGKRPATYFFIALLGGFLLMMSMGISTLLSIGGAVAIAFCSYNMQIIQVGHNTKMQAIAFFPWVLAALIFTYRRATSPENGREFRKWFPFTLLGAACFGLTLSFQIKANHPQITYYLAILVLLYALVVFISLCAKKDKHFLFKNFFIASALLLAIGLTGIATNTNKLLPTLRYSEYTMRGGSELSDENSKESDSEGLKLDYATAWSYGWEELPNLMIADFNGGSSAGKLPMDSETAKLLKQAGQPNLEQTLKFMPLYWGPQPFTAGPMYIGAISIFLFLLGIFLYRDKEKWWLLVGTILAILLAVGSHFMAFTEFCFNYLPMYNKFRTVSMALIILQVTVPLLGFIVLDRIMKEHYDKKAFLKAGIPAFVISAGFCLLCMLFPGVAGSFSSAADAGQPEILVDALVADRIHLFRKDAATSLLHICITFSLIYWIYQNKEPFVVKMRTVIASAAICVMLVLNLGLTGKRYLNKDHFISGRQFNKDFPLTAADRSILEDEDPDYRVLDLTKNIFNSSEPSYWHKSIGGYSPAKLQRYQDLIERNLMAEIQAIPGAVNEKGTAGLLEMPVLNLLNMKYIIYDGAAEPILNPFAMGHCWVVDRVLPASGPNEEIDFLAAFYPDPENGGNPLADPYTTAIVGDDFDWARNRIREISGRTDGHIDLIHYAPNYLRYRSDLTAESAVLFSEIYYPDGWKAWFEPEDEEMGTVRKGRYQPSENAVELDLFRADWILRGAIVPEGRGEVVMRFEPQSYVTGARTSTVTSILLILIMLGAGGYAVAEHARNCRRKEDQRQ